MRRLLVTLLMLLFAGTPLWAQVADTAGWHMHLSTGTSIANGFGQTQALGWVAPSFELHPTSRLTVSTGLAAAGDILPSDYTIKGFNDQSLAPRREGTRVHALWAKAEYQVNDRLWLWGAISHVGGFMQPLWLNQSLPLQATSFSGGFSYALTQRSFFEMHFHIVHDHYSTLSHCLYPYYGLYSPNLSLFENPWPY
ncbi:MAG: hypothetical protein K6E96_05045 [Bacteroidales bacterium]|nr:hypothetical protein [Bacteroidales bacterium]